LVSYFLAMRCYDFFPKDFAPVIHQAICAVRAAWLCTDLERNFPGENYEYLGRMFYRKARFFYALAMEYEQQGKQTITACANLGPDLDKNYGYDGVIYLNAYLEYHFGPRKDKARRIESLTKAKRSVARIFGMGRASRNKPQPLLDNARTLYNTLAEYLGHSSNPESDAQEGD